MTDTTIPITPDRPRDLARHPLDPLTPDEMRRVVEAVRRERRIGDEHLFIGVRLAEPEKQQVHAFREGQPLDRLAEVGVWDRATRTVYEGRVSVAGEVRDWRPVPGARSPVMAVEAERAINATKAEPRIRAALKARGITDPDRVHVEPWPFGASMPDPLRDGRRVVWTPMWDRPSPDDNQYAHPIYGLYAIVDLDSGQVIDVEDRGHRPIPREPGRYRSHQLPPPRDDLRDLAVVQRDGPSFAIDGWKITWQKWALRIGFCPREGLVIHDVRYDDDGRMRRIAHRLSIAELVIPYGDPNPGSYRKAAFDTGEYGIGYYTNSLELGCDCLGEIRYLDVSVVDADGSVRTIRNGICLHEEDDGILWKHTDTDGHTEVRRSRRFVASSIFTVDNYEYGYFWYFYQDGTIEFEAKLTGVVLTNAPDPDIEGRYATEVAPGLLAPYHQHIFCARLDVDIDGEPNSVVEINTVAPPRGPANPYGGSFVAEETGLASESAAKRVVDPFTSRYWKIINPKRRNRLDAAVGYKLVPGHTTYPLAFPDSDIGQRAGFMYHHLWVTPFAADERYPAGDYPFVHAGGAGLPAWTQADRGIDDTDVVVWYVFGNCHIPRPEDWPVMPVERAGFHLKPVGFFARNPAMDVAAPNGHCQH